jgi:hypothetical protein
MAKKIKVPSVDVLALRFESDDLNRELTIREWLAELLLTLWREEEGFSGKRPFGNSGWQRDVAAVLIKAGAITGKLDEYGQVAEADDEELKDVIENAILEMTK